MAKDVKRIPPANTRSDNKPAETHHILPSRVVDNEEEIKIRQQTRSREKAIETRRRDAQFPSAIETLIDEYCNLHSRAKNPAIAKWLRKEHKPLLDAAKLKPGWLPLARKIGRYRRRK